MPCRRNGARPSRPGKHADGTVIVVSVVPPQWSPAFTAGETRDGTGRPDAACGSRNGARPSRPGKHVEDDTRELDDLAAMEPGLHGRGNARLPVSGVPRRPAAMEPGLHGRGNLRPSTRPRWRPRRRNGARPSRPGKPGRPRRSRPGRRCRNGARPSRPGKQLLHTVRVEKARCKSTRALHSTSCLRLVPVGDARMSNPLPHRCEQ